MQIDVLSMKRRAIMFDDKIDLQSMKCNGLMVQHYCHGLTISMYGNSTTRAIMLDNISTA